MHDRIVPFKLVHRVRYIPRRCRKIRGQYLASEEFLAFLELSQAEVRVACWVNQIDQSDKIKRFAIRKFENEFLRPVVVDAGHVRGSSFLQGLEEGAKWVASFLGQEQPEQGVPPKLEGAREIKESDHDEVWARVQRNAAQIRLCHDDILCVAGGEPVYVCSDPAWGPPFVVGVVDPTPRDRGYFNPLPLGYQDQWHFEEKASLGLVFRADELMLAKSVFATRDAQVTVVATIDLDQGQELRSDPINLQVASALRLLKRRLACRREFISLPSIAPIFDAINRLSTRQEISTAFGAATLLDFVTCCEQQEIDEASELFRAYEEAAKAVESITVNCGRRRIASPFQRSELEDLAIETLNG